MEGFLFNGFTQNVWIYTTNLSVVNSCNLTGDTILYKSKTVNNTYPNEPDLDTRQFTSAN